MYNKNMLIFLKNKDTLQCDEFLFKCSVGKKRFNIPKKEGDFKTPRVFLNLIVCITEKIELKNQKQN